MRVDTLNLTVLIMRSHFQDNKLSCLPFSKLWIECSDTMVSEQRERKGEEGKEAKRRGKEARRRRMRERKKEREGEREEKRREETRREERRGQGRKTGEEREEWEGSKQT